MEQASEHELSVYRRGNKTAKNFTPRPGKDTTSRTGQAPGLSTAEHAESGFKAQRISLPLLRPPLKAIRDDPAQEGTPGHVSITPVDENGNVDQALLEQWAAYRELEEVHPFTQIVLDAIIEADCIKAESENLLEEKG